MEGQVEVAQQEQQLSNEPSGAIEEQKSALAKELDIDDLIKDELPIQKPSIQPPRLNSTDSDAPKIKGPVIPGQRTYDDEVQLGSRQNLVLRQIPQCPCFEPTLEEFTEMGFQEYLVEAEKWLEPNCGVYKVSLCWLLDVYIQYQFVVLFEFCLQLILIILIGPSTRWLGTTKGAI